MSGVLDVGLLNDLTWKTSGIDAVNYLDEVLTSPEAPQAAGNDEPIPVPSHQPTYNGSNIKEKYIHILYL